MATKSLCHRLGLAECGVHDPSAALLCPTHLQRGHMVIPPHCLLLSYGKNLGGGKPRQFSLGALRCVAETERGVRFFDVCAYSGNGYALQSQGRTPLASFAVEADRNARLLDSSRSSQSSAGAAPALYCSWPLGSGLRVQPNKGVSKFLADRGTLTVATLAVLAHNEAAVTYDRRLPETGAGMAALEDELAALVASTTCEELRAAVAANPLVPDVRARVFQLLFRYGVYLNHLDTSPSRIATMLERVERVLTLAELFAGTPVERARCWEELHLPVRRASKWPEAMALLDRARGVLLSAPAGTPGVERRLRSVQHNRFRAFGPHGGDEAEAELRQWYEGALASARLANDQSEAVRTLTTYARFYHMRNEFRTAYDAYCLALRRANAAAEGELSDKLVKARLLSDIVQCASPLEDLHPSLKEHYDRLADELRRHEKTQADCRRRLTDVYSACKALYKRTLSRKRMRQPFCPKCDLPVHDGMSCDERVRSAAAAAASAAVIVAPPPPPLAPLECAAAAAAETPASKRPRIEVPPVVVPAAPGPPQPAVFDALLPGAGMAASAAGFAPVQFQPQPGAAAGVAPVQFQPQPVAAAAPAPGFAAPLANDAAAAPPAIEDVALSASFFGAFQSPDAFGRSYDDLWDQ